MSLLSKKIQDLHLIIIFIFIFVLVLVIYLPRTSSKEKPLVHAPVFDTTVSINLSTYIDKDKSIAHIIQQYQQQKIEIDSLIKFFNKKGWPALSAYFEEIKYLPSQTDTIWYHVGKNYYNAIGFVSHTEEIDPLLASAARCFNRALTLNPNNTDAKIMLASCYVQTKNPMLGIKMLKELEKTDSNNVLLQIQLAEFSWRSNQLDKAIQRYYKALKLDSSKIEIYAYLSNIYLEKKDTLQSIQFLRKFADKISDTTLKQSIQNYIHQLNKAHH